MNTGSNSLTPKPHYDSKHSGFKNSWKRFPNQQPIKRTNQFKTTEMVFGGDSVSYFNEDNEHENSSRNPSESMNSINVVDVANNKQTKLNDTRFYMSPIKFTNYLKFVFSNDDFDANVYTLNITGNDFNIINKSNKNIKKDKTAICFAFLFGKCNKNANDCVNSHTVLNPAAWNFMIISSLLRESYIWINVCVDEKNNVGKNSILYDGVFEKAGCSFWHGEYSECQDSSSECKNGLNCRDLFCKSFHSIQTRRLFPEVIEFLSSYKIIFKNKQYAVTYNDRSLYKDEVVDEKTKSSKNELTPPTKSQDVRISLPYFHSEQTASHIIYSLQNRINKLELEKVELKNELRFQNSKYNSLETSYKKQSQYCLDLAKQLEALKNEDDFKRSASLVHPQSDEE